MPSNDEKLYVLRVELLAGAESFESMDEAIGHATLKVQSDRIPRAVVRVSAQMEADTKPAVVITHFDTGAANENQTQ